MQWYKTYYRFQDLISSNSISIAADFDFVWQLAHRNLKPVDITDSRLLLHDGVLPLFQLTNLWIFKKMVCLEDTTPFMQGHKTYYRFQDLISSDSISIAADFDFVWQLAHRNLQTVDTTESRLLLHDGVLPLFQLTNLWIFKKMVCLEDTTPFMQGHIKTYYRFQDLISSDSISIAADFDFVWQLAHRNLKPVDITESRLLLHDGVLPLFQLTNLWIFKKMVCLKDTTPFMKGHKPYYRVSVPRPNFIRFHLDCSRFRFCLATCSSKSPNRRHHWVQIVTSWWGFTTFPTHEPVDFQENGLSWRYNTIYAMI